MLGRDGESGSDRASHQEQEEQGGAGRRPTSQMSVCFLLDGQEKMLLTGGEK